MKQAYLWVDLLTILPPLVFSFHSDLFFYRSWRSVWPAILVSAGVFLGWDSYYTHLGVWGFNDRYLTGAALGNLPAEEWLFFICIPYACLFTLYSLRTGGTRFFGPATADAITWTLVALLVITGAWKLQCRYTASTFISLAVMLLSIRYICKADWLGRFYAWWIVLMIPLILVDGLLTGTGLAQPIVWYRANDIIGLRVGTIPVEDFLYGMELILLNVLLADRFGRLDHRKTSRFL